MKISKFQSSQNILNFVENRIKKQLKPFYKKRHMKKVDFETIVKKLTQKPFRGCRNEWTRPYAVHIFEENQKLSVLLLDLVVLKAYLATLTKTV